MINLEIEKEADLLSRYLIGREASVHTKKMYIRVLKYNPNLSISNKDQKLIRFAFKHTYTIRFLDSAMALTRPNSELRRRIYIMLAILEAHPDNFDKFDTLKKGHFYKLNFAFRVALASVAAIIGVMLAKIVEVKP